MHTYRLVYCTLLQCSGELAAAVIGYLYTGQVEADASTAAEVMSLANLWQLPGMMLLQHTLMPKGLVPYILHIHAFAQSFLSGASR